MSLCGVCKAYFLLYALHIRPLSPPRTSLLSLPPTMMEKKNQKYTPTIYHMPDQRSIGPPFFFYRFLLFFRLRHAAVPPPARRTHTSRLADADGHLESSVQHRQRPPRSYGTGMTGDERFEQGYHHLPPDDRFRPLAVSGRRPLEGVARPRLLEASESQVRCSQ